MNSQLSIVNSTEQIVNIQLSCSAIQQMNSKLNSSTQQTILTKYPVLRNNQLKNQITCSSK